MPLFGKKKSKMSPADEAFIDEMNTLATEDTNLDGAFNMMEKFQDIDVDAIQKESEEMIIKVDFIVFSIRKMVTLLEKGIEGTIEMGDVNTMNTEINEEFDNKVKHIYEDDNK